MFYIEKSPWSYLTISTGTTTPPSDSMDSGDQDAPNTPPRTLRSGTVLLTVVNRAASGDSPERPVGNSAHRPPPLMLAISSPNLLPLRVPRVQNHDLLPLHAPRVQNQPHDDLLGRDAFLSVHRRKAVCQPTLMLIQAVEWPQVWSTSGCCRSCRHLMLFSCRGTPGSPADKHCAYES